MLRVNFARLSSIVILTLLSSCSGGGGSNSDTADNTTDSNAQGDFFSQRSDLALASLTTTSDAAGENLVTIDLPSGATKFSVTATAGTYISTDRITSADGTVHLDYQGEFKTLSTYFSPFVTSVSTPSRDFDTPVNGGTFTIATTVASGVNDDGSFSPAVGESVVFTTVSSRDKDLSSGILPVNLIYVGGTGANAEYRAAVQAATTRFAEIYRKIGIEIQATEVDLDGPAILPLLNVGDPVYLNLSAAVAYPALNVCIGYDIQEGILLGEAGGIPGAPIPTVKSCVAVSMLTNAGPTGTFDASTLELLAETLAHEGGHYLGLFHVVESSYVTFDTLTDTVVCSGSADCEANLGANLMFPYPVRDGAGAYITQDGLTAQQGGVMNRYVAVS